MLLHQIGLFNIAVAREGTNDDVVAIFFNVRQLFNVRDVNECCRRHQTQLHERNERVPTCKKFCFVTVFCK